MNKKIEWGLVFDKLGTIVVDRRFWLMFVFPVVFALGIFPSITPENSEAMSDQAVEWSKLIVGAVVPVLSTIMLGTSWTKRAPSGTRFKEPSSEVEELAKLLTEKISQ